jgi:hypothetical protein
MSSKRNQFTHGGYCDWGHASVRLCEHKQSKSHLESVVALAGREKAIGRIDRELQKQVEQQTSYWIQVLQRLVSVLKFACERGLALRGDNDIIGSPSNGNYLGLLELLAEYDVFLQQHIQKHSNCGSGHVNYLSSTVCEELVSQMGKSVLNEIISRIKKSKYFSFSLDSTTDEGHVDQLTLTFRYIESTMPVERFVTFMPNQGHKAEDMFQGLLQFLSAHDIDIKDCRGQSYDNAAAMSGRYNGLQAKVASMNALAEWIPCAAHSLNLVGKASAESCPAAIRFFIFLEELYTFFTGSTRRYATLRECLSSSGSHVCVPKRVTGTRFSCRSDAAKALAESYPQYLAALSKIRDDPDEMPEVRSKAKALHVQLSLLETGIYSVFWHEFLARVDCTNTILQNPILDLNTAVAALKSLKFFVESKRDCFSEYESQGKKKSGTAAYQLKRPRKYNVMLNPLDYAQAPAAELSPSEKFRVHDFLPIIDHFCEALQKRISAYELISSRFGFLRSLEALSPKDIRPAAQRLVDIYKEDLDASLAEELVQFSEFARTFLEEEGTDFSREHFMYRLLVEKGVVAAFPNVEITLRIYLVLMLTNCTAERSFSKMKMIKNRLRTSMTDDRLNNLAIMSIEHDILRQLDFSALVSDFARRKSRKVPLSAL